MKTDEAFRKLSDLRVMCHYKLCVSLEDGRSTSADDIEIDDPSNPDEVGKWYAIQEIYSLLNDAFALTKYYEMPIVGEGRLRKNQNGRYEIAGFELTSGCVIELLNEEDETPMWVRTAIEHDGEDYYAVSMRGSLQDKHGRYR